MEFDDRDGFAQAQRKPSFWADSTNQLLAFVLIALLFAGVGWTSIWQGSGSESAPEPVRASSATESPESVEYGSDREAAPEQSPERDESTEFTPEREDAPDLSPERAE